jgi:prevent-host-death family protein
MDHLRQAVAKPRETTIPVTEFKAKCLAVIERVASGKAGRVVLTKRGKPVAAIVSIGKGLPNPRGALKGTVFIPPGVDITEPTGEDWEANR